MKTVSIEGQVREANGKTGTKKVRSVGRVPAVMYGHDEPIPVSVEYTEIEKLLFTPDVYVVHVNIDGTEVPSIIKEAQFHPVTEKILHVDFLRLKEDHPIEMDVPLQLVGSPKGVFDGGKLVASLRKLRIFGVPTKLPDALEVDISDVGLGQTFKVSDLQLEGVEIRTAPTISIAKVIIPRAVIVDGVEGEEGEEGEEEEGDEESED